MFMPLIVYSLVIEFVSLGLTRNYSGVVKNFGTTIILNTIQVSILLMVDVLFPLLMTFIELFKRICRLKKVDSGIEKTLQNPEIENMFIQHCEREYSLENILCYRDIRDFRITLHDPLTIYFGQKDLCHERQKNFN
jgi:hypothetical protein